MDREAFIINDIHGILNGKDERNNYVKDENGKFLSFSTYGEANEAIGDLPNGIYKIEKVKVHIRDGSNDPTQTMPV